MPPGSGGFTKTNQSFAFILKTTRVSTSQSAIGAPFVVVTRETNVVAREASVRILARAVLIRLQQQGAQNTGNTQLLHRTVFANVAGALLAGLTGAQLQQ